MLGPPRSADRTTLSADGGDAGIITVAALDAKGRQVPVAADEVSFAIEGPGRILGVGNGDPSSHEPDVFLGEKPGWRRKLFNGLAQVIVRSGGAPGDLILTAAAPGLAPARIVFQIR